jgi:hypothetical protein
VVARNENEPLPHIIHAKSEQRMFDAGRTHNVRDGTRFGLDSSEKIIPKVPICVAHHCPKVGSRHTPFKLAYILCFWAVAGRLSKGA